MCSPPPSSAAVAQLDHQTNRAIYRLMPSTPKTLQFAYIDTSDQDFSTNTKENKTKSSLDVASKRRQDEMRAALLDSLKLMGPQHEQGEIDNRPPRIAMNRQTRFSLRRLRVPMPNADFLRHGCRRRIWMESEPTAPQTDHGRASGSNSRARGCDRCNARQVRKMRFRRLIDGRIVRSDD